MTDNFRDEALKELQFNADYLMDKYGLDNLIILAGKTCEDGTTDFNVERGNGYANVELCRRLAKITDTTYEDDVLNGSFNNIDNGDELYG